MTNLFHFPEVRVVEASAGSGKTYALAKRYVQLLLNPALHLDQVPMRNILAITFTNKAAFEMKARILDFLKKTALNSLSEQEEGNLLTPIGLTRKDAAAKAFKVMEELVHNYNFFQVQTIDSFINALLIGCAFKVGLSAQFRIRTNPQDYLEYSLDGVLQSAAHNPETLKTFERFLHQYLFLENKAGWFPKKDMLGLVNALYQQNNTFGEPLARYALGEGDMLELKRKIITNMQKLREQLPEGTDGRFIKSLEKFLEKYTSGFDIDRVSDYFARLELPLKKGAVGSRAADALWDRIRVQLKDLCEAEAYGLFNPYIDIFELISKDFKGLAARDDVMFLPELNKKARLLFDDGGLTVEELYYRLATRFRHYLIDEFQDTSRLQWRNLFLMVEEALSTGGSLFYVGDKKQAIYGFRGGDWHLFDDVKTQLAMFNVQPEVLSVNYRSQKAIVDFVGKIFCPDNLVRFIHDKEDSDIQKKKKDACFFSPDDRAAVARIFSGAVQQPLPENSRGYVEVAFVDGKTKEERDELSRERLLRTVSDLSGRVALKDIAVLTRNNKQVEDVTAWLLEAGVPAQSERTMNIKENFIVKEMLDLLRFLDSPIDNMAFARFLLGDVFVNCSGLSAQDIQAFLFGLRKRTSQEREFYLYIAFRETYPEIWEQFLAVFFRNVGLYPLYELAVSVVARLKILENFSDQQGFVMRFLELIKEQEEETVDVGTFLTVFEGLQGEGLFVRVADADAVRVLTVHKAKGLEFPVVVAPFLGMDIQLGASGDLGQQSYLLDVRDEHLELLRVKAKYSLFSEHLAELRRQEYLRSFLSELNNVYVALTRASQELYVFIPSRIGNSHNVAKWLIPEEAYCLGKQVPELKPPKPRKDHPVLPRADYCDWLELLQEEFSSAGEVVHRDRLRQGEVCHALLAEIVNLHDRDRDDVLNDAVVKAQRAFPDISDWRPYRQIIEPVLRHVQLQQFFDLDEADVWTEYDLVDRDGRSLRLDRLIVLKDKVWVVDYKMTRHDETAYHDQVRRYMTVLSDIYPDKKVEGFLIYLDERESEAVKA